MSEIEDLKARIAAFELLVRDHDLAPYPPTDLRVRVSGWEDPDHFLGVGRKIFWDIKRLLSIIDHKLADFREILDFGCGCGRTVRFFQPGQYHVTGCDIDPESIAWCRENLPHIARFEVTAAVPPLPFATVQFDLIYCISVFTHLPEEMQFAWLCELARVLKPGGILIASTHGASLLPADAADLHKQLQRDGILYVTGSGTGGLPDFYQTTFHLPEYVRERWTERFLLRHTLPRGINNHQDAYVFERA